MDVEHKVVSLPVDDKLQAEVQKLEAEGWQISPGVVPVMVYHLVRAKKLEQPEAEAPRGSLPFKLTIDDALIQVIGPDGKRK